MPFSKFFRRKGLRPSWEFSTEGILWRLHPAPGPKFVGEERNLTSRTATFFCLDALTGKPSWRGREYGDGWWTGLSGIYHGVILFHGFATPELPEAKKIIAVDLLSGRELWRNEELTFLGVKEGDVIASRQTPRGRETLRASLVKGSIEGIVEPEEARQLLLDPDEDERGSGDTRFPVLIGAAGRLDPPIVDLLRNAGAEPARETPLQYLDHDHTVVIGHVIADAAKGMETPVFAAFVTVVEKSTGLTLYRDRLDNALPFPPQGSFMTRGKFLYYIRNRKTITAVAIQMSRQATPLIPSTSR